MLENNNTKEFNKYEVQSLVKELREYAKRYESSLRLAGETEEEIKNKVDKWVDDTYDFYIKSGENIEDVIRNFAFLNETGAEIQTENVVPDIIKKVK